MTAFAGTLINIMLAAGIGSLIADQVALPVNAGLIISFTAFIVLEIFQIYGPGSYEVDKL